MKKKIVYGVVLVLVVIQFIRPGQNISTGPAPDEITVKYKVPDDVHAILKKSCYDCHSNNTVYPWYSNIQPLGWWLQHHVNEGKEELNFSVFSSYKEKRAKHKFEEIEKEVKEGEMPLSSYTLIHGDAKLSPEQATALTTWAASLK